MKPKNILVEARDGSQLVIEGDTSIPSGVIRVANPLEFLNQFELAAESKNGHSPKDAMKEGGKKGARILWQKIRAGEIEQPWVTAKKNREKMTRQQKAKRRHELRVAAPAMLSSKGLGRDGPRLGVLHISVEDEERILDAVESRDNGLSPMQLAVLKSRLGIGKPAMKVHDIAKELRVAHHTNVSAIFFSALRVLGIRRKRTKRMSR